MTFVEKFEELKKLLDKADTKKLKDDFAIQITMNDEDCGGTFYVAYLDGNYSVEPYDYYDNTANIDASADVIKNLAEKTTDVETEINQGKMFVGGNVENVKSLFDAMKKKPAKKAPTTKKTTAKTTTKKTVAKKPTVKKTTSKKSTSKTADKTKLSAVHSGTAVQMKVEGLDVN